MDIKPIKPDTKVVAPVKELDTAIAKSKKTKADTKALETANKALKAAAKDLGKAMDVSFKAFDGAYSMTVDVCKTPAPAGPVPIPYPTISKVEKKSKSALSSLETAQKKHSKACEKLIKVIDKETKVLKAEARTSSGDEAGTLKGLVSAKSMIKSQMSKASLNVKVEGKNVVRYFDILNKNLKNAEKK